MLIAIVMNQNMAALAMVVVVMMAMMINSIAEAADTNKVFDPCSDAKIQKSDGFTFGLAFSTKDSFFFNQTQLSPCDRRLSLSSKKAQLALFRPKIDETSLLTIHSTTFNSTSGYMVAFAGRKYVARSIPVFVADNTHTITNFTLVLEFQKGIQQNLHWKKYGCASCSEDSSSVCINNQDCAIPSSKCKIHGGTIDCNLGIQLTFSGTDKNDNVLNSWYEVDKLRRFSLYGLYSNLRNPIIDQTDNIL